VRDARIGETSAQHHAGERAGRTVNARISCDRSPNRARSAPEPGRDVANRSANRATAVTRGVEMSSSTRRQWVPIDRWGSMKSVHDCRTGNGRAVDSQTDSKTADKGGSERLTLEATLPLTSGDGPPRIAADVSI
jgi:hypothetical protein